MRLNKVCRFLVTVPAATDDQTDRPVTDRTSRQTDAHSAGKKS